MVFDFSDNAMILAEGCVYDLDCYKTRRNNNVLVVGASGAGKTRNIVTPNLLMAKGSYIISDPKGNLYNKFRNYLRKEGYEVLRVDFTNPEASEGYNFFRYIRSDIDILKIAHMLIYDKPGVGNHSDPFWDEMAELLLGALIGYLHYYRPESEQNIESIGTLLRACKINENKVDEENAIDLIMKEVARKDPNSFVAKQYEMFRAGAGKTLRSILISVNAHMGKLEVSSIQKMLCRKSIDFAKIGHQKTAVFVVVSDTDRSLDTLANLFFSQAMNELCYEADHFCADCKLPVDVRFFLDDFATNCRINEFPRMIASIRSRGISTMLMVQDEAQLMAGYGEDGDTIIANCDTYLYLSGNSIQTAQSVAQRANVPMNRILTMPVDSAWVFRRGEQPIFTKTIDLDEFLKAGNIVPDEIPVRSHDNTPDAQKECADFLKEAEAEMDEDFAALIDDELTIPWDEDEEVLDDDGELWTLSNDEIDQLIAAVPDMPAPETPLPTKTKKASADNDFHSDDIKARAEHTRNMMLWLYGIENSFVNGEEGVFKIYMRQQMSKAINEMYESMEPQAFIDMMEELVAQKKPTEASTREVAKLIRLARMIDEIDNKPAV